MSRHFGVLIPSTNTTVEIEFSGLLPPGLHAHIGRLGKGGASPFSPSLDADVAYQSELLGTARVEAIVLAQTSASLFSDDYDTNVTTLMADNAKAPALTSAQAIGRAVKALGVRRIGLATPYSTEVLGRAKRYFEMQHGLEVVAMEGFGATDSYAIGKMDADTARAAFARIDRPDVEVLVVPGGNFPTMPWIERWEQAFGKPVVTTNQASLWGALTLMKITAPIEGLGRLLSTMPRG
jgi:maleate cis-trans isomerase